MEGIIYKSDFLQHSEYTIDFLKRKIVWDERMTIRKTASYGVAYNYSQMNYPYQPMLPVLKSICLNLISVIGFEPNNCLINYYPDGKFKMGYHADQTDILADDTGIAIISLGETRVLRFRKIDDKTETIDFTLTSGSLIYLIQDIQKDWEHSIPKSDTNNVRMSLTFRRIAS